MTKTSELDELKERIAELERAATPPDPAAQERASAEFRAEMHRMREGRMAYAMHPSVYRDMAMDDATARSIVRDHYGAPSGPSMSGIPSSQTVTGVRPGGGPANVPGGGSGWVQPVSLSNPPGVALADRLMDAQDARDRAELIEREAKLRAMERLAEPKQP